MVLEQIEKKEPTTFNINNKNNYKKYGWKNIAVKIKENDLVLLNRQLDRLGYETLGDLVKDLLLGKITHLTEEKQIEAMKINMQGSGQNTAQLGAYYDFYKNIDVDDLLKEFMKRYHPRTARCFVICFGKYADIFFGKNPDVELFKLKPHKRSWILQSIKKMEIFIFGNIILEIFKIWSRG